MVNNALLAGLPRITAKVHPHGTTAAVEYEGVSLGAALSKCGVPSGEAIRGPKLRSVVLVEAADGYAAAFALPELDPAFTEKRVLLVDRREGKPLPASEGPFRLIIPDEHRQARWVRQVMRIQIREIK